MTDRPPVSDWATDFDHLDPRWVTEPYRIWDELRRQCPVAHSERYNGVYFPSRYADVRAIAYDTSTFLHAAWSFAKCRPAHRRVPRSRNPRRQRRRWLRRRSPRIHRIIDRREWSCCPLSPRTPSAAWRRERARYAATWLIALHRTAIAMRRSTTPSMFP